MAIFSLSRHSSPKMDSVLHRKIQFLAIQRQEELEALGSVRRELDGLYQALETVTDEKLVDSVIYETNHWKQGMTITSAISSRWTAPYAEKRQSGYRMARQRRFSPMLRGNRL